jgi:hypothetical protein
MLTALALTLAQDNDGNAAGGMAAIFGGIGGCCCGLIWLALVVAIIAGFWKVFVKAGEPGWAAIVPIYNAIILLKIAGKPIWWIVLMFVPLLNIVILFLVDDAVAKRFGKSTGFAIVMLIFPYVGYPMLGFSKTTVYNPSATPTTK